MVNVLKQHPQNYLLKQYFDGSEFPNISNFETINISDHFVVSNDESMSVINGDVTIHGTLIMSNPDNLEIDLAKIQQRYLYIYEPNNIESKSDIVPSGDKNGSNKSFTIVLDSGKVIKPYSLFVNVDDDTLITDNGDGTLSDGGTIVHSSG
jgi:hypothetical protein